MKKQRFSVEQIVSVLKQAEIEMTGRPIRQTARL